MTYSIAFSPDNKYLASGSHDNTVKIWNMNTFECVSTLKGHSEYVWVVCYSNNGSLIASGSFDNTLIIWNSKSYEKVAVLSENTGTIYSVKFSPDD